MTTNFSSDLSKALWDDYEGQKAFPTQRPLLAHYTSIGTFEKIVNNQERACFWPAMARWT